MDKVKNIVLKHDGPGPHDTGSTQESHNPALAKKPKGFARLLTQEQGNVDNETGSWDKPKKERKRIALQKAVESILEGHRDMDDAKSYYDAFVERGDGPKEISGYTAMGYEFHMEDVKYAMDLVDADPGLKPSNWK